MTCSLGFYGDGISFWVVFSQSFWLRVLPGGANLVQPRCMPERRILGGQTCGVSFWPFLNSSGWWWRIRSVFLSRTSCCKTTHANGYYGASPGWAVSVSVLPLTVSGLRTLCLTLIKIKTLVLYLLCGVLSYCVTPISFPLLSQITLLILLVTKCVAVSPHNKQISVTPAGCPTT